MNMHKSFRVQELAEKLYSELRAQGIEVLLDDRKERPGVMFADMELIGIPHTIVLLSLIHIYSVSVSNCASVNLPRAMPDWLVTTTSAKPVSYTHLYLRHQAVNFVP